MKTFTLRNIARHLGVVIIALAFGAIGITAQNSLPVPGSGGSYMPSPGPGPAPGPGWGDWGDGWNGGWNGCWNGCWGSPWGPGYSNYTGPIIINTPLSSPDWQNAGTTSVVACGYDTMGVWRNIPLSVAYQYNGTEYDVTVINAWDPWTRTWDRDIDVPAVNTTYLLKGTTFHFYVVLSTGTFYFNL